ncbi:MAG: CDP-alcohol phosphatidyltransferase family protein [Candidatus Falkowbacteria bacterium]
MVCQLKEGPKQRVLTVANLITFLGMAGAIWSIWLLYNGYLVASIIVYTLSALTDFADGWVARYIEARHPGRGVSKFGTFLDPARDKMLGVIIIPLTIIGGISVLVPIYLIAGEVFVVGILAARYADSGGMHVLKVSKFISLCQSIVIFVWFLLLYFDKALMSPVSMIALIILAALSLWRAFCYWAYLPKS